MAFLVDGTAFRAVAPDIGISLRVPGQSSRRSARAGAGPGSQPSGQASLPAIGDRHAARSRHPAALTASEDGINQRSPAMNDTQPSADQRAAAPRARGKGGGHVEEVARQREVCGSDRIPPEIYPP